MGQKLYEIQERMNQMEGFARGILKAAAEIKEIRAECMHCWNFSFQTNDYHEHIWNVVYQCNECGEQRNKKKKPVCEACDSTLKRAGKNDTEAQKERKKEKYQGHDNPPIAFRCPQCKKIHILWTRGD